MPDEHRPVTLRSPWLKALATVLALAMIAFGAHQIVAAGPTYVSGAIGASTSWTTLGSPYIITGDVTVAAGATLTIRPGVQVRFTDTDDQSGGNYPTRPELIILGRLDAVGTEEAPVIFTSHAAVPFGADWGEIAIHSDSNTIAHAEIRYATYGVRFYGTGGNPSTNNTISDTLFHKNGDDSLVDDGPPCVGGGADEEGGAIRGEYVDQSVFLQLEIHSGERGIWLENSDNNEVRECRIYDLQQSAIRLAGDSNGNLIRANIIYDVADYGIVCWGNLGGEGNDNTLSYNSIHDTWDAGLVFNRQISGDVDHNVIYSTASNPEDRFCNGAGYPLNLISGVWISATTDSQIGDNTIHSSGSEEWGIDVPGLYIADGAVDNVVLRNDIHDNLSDGVVIVGATTDRNTLSENLIYSNKRLGIDLGDDGVTANDGGDVDIGPNDEFNYPEISWVAYLGGDQYLIQGTSGPGATVELFVSDYDPSGHGEGTTFVTRTVTAGSGVWSMLCTIPGNILGATTGTDVQGNTSEFGGNTVIAGHVWVDDDWAGSSFGEYIESHVYGVDAFSTIQEGVDAVAISGTVHILPGVYREQVVIEKSGLTLEGENRAQVILRDGGISEYGTIHASGVQNAALTINADRADAGHPVGITIRGMTIERADAAIYMPQYTEDTLIEDCNIRHSLFGLLIEQDAITTTIVNNVFEDNEYAVAVGLHYIDTNSYTHARNLTISSNQFLDSDHQLDLQGETAAVVIWEPDCANPTSDVRIEYNVIRDQSLGIYLTGVHSATIYSNDISDIPYRVTESNFAENGYGIFLYAWSGAAGCGPDGAQTKDVLVVTNTIRSSYKGLVIRGADDVQVYGNSIVGNASDGVEVSVSDNSQAHWAAPTTLYAQNIEMHGNAICGNGDYQLNHTQPAPQVGVLPALYNWWGTNTPTAGVEIVAASNVDFTPWLTMSLSAEPSSMSASATSAALIYATYVGGGYHIPDGHIVFWETSFGTIDPPVSATFGGLTWTTLSATQEGTAVITATDECGQVMTITVDALGYNPDATITEHDTTVQAHSDETFEFFEYVGDADTAVITITFPFRFDFNTDLPVGANVGIGSVQSMTPSVTCPLAVTVSDVLTREVPIGSGTWITYSAHWLMDVDEGCSVLPDRDIWITGTQEMGWTWLVAYPPDGDYVMTTTVTTTLTIFGEIGATPVITNPSCATYYPIGIWYLSELNQLVCRSTGVTKEPTSVWYIDRYPIGPAFQRGIINTTLPEPFVAWVHDDSWCNNGIPDVPIIWDIILAPEGATGQRITVHHPYTDETGRAPAWLTLGDKTGQYVIRAWSLQARGEAIFSAQATDEGCTVTLVSYGIDDTWVSDDDGNHRETEYLWLGDGRYDLGLRFREPGMPQGSLISSAFVRFSPFISSTAPITMTIYGEATDYADPFLASSPLVPARPRTNASVDWIIDCLHWKSWIRPESPDISPIIQEIVDRPGWRFHNALAILLIADSKDRGNGYRSVYSYDGALAENTIWNAPELEVCYIPPWAVTPGPSPTATATPTATYTPTPTSTDSPIQTSTPTKRSTATGTPPTATPSATGTLPTPTMTETRVPVWTPTPTSTTAPQGEIRGMVWEDNNEDGEITFGEPPINGAQILLRSEQGDLLDTTMTGEDGLYSFPGLTPSTYIVQEVDLPGYFSTTTNSALVELSAGEIAFADFGDKRLGNSPWGTIHLPAVLGGR